MKYCSILRAEQTPDTVQNAMIFRYFTYAFIDQFAQQSVNQFEATVSAPKLAATHAKHPAKQAEKANHALERMLADVQRFITEHKLNLFQHARLAQQLQNKAINCGYPVPLARDIATGVFGMRARK